MIADAIAFIGLFIIYTIAEYLDNKEGKAMVIFVILTAIFWSREHLRLVADMMQ